MLPVEKNESTFLGQLTTKLIEKESWDIQQDRNNEYADIIVVDTNTGKRIFIEVKNAGEYGELPISSIIPISNQAKRITAGDKIFLITFSGIPNLLNVKLKELNVKAFMSPSVDEVFNDVQLALSA